MSQASAPPRARRPAWPWLALIVVAYVAIASLYAVRLPAWQAPDEPAHYNYVHELASTGQFPVLRMGDYDEAYLERLKSQGFPPSLPIHPVRYEAHQPPLYYLLASAVFRLTQGQLLFLRLLSVALGAVFVVLTYEIVRQIYPQRAAVRLAAAAFVAFLPMHVALAASVNNDALAEVLLAGILLLSIRYVKRWLLGPNQPGGLEALALGLLLGMALVTKVSSYVAIPVVLAALVIVGYETRRTTSHANEGRLLRTRGQGSTLAVHTVLIFLPALIIALPWYARNAQVYGNLDILGRRWHDTVVVGQLRTGDLLAQSGLASVLERFFVWSHDSFWGVFGWMGVWMDGRIYTALLAFSLAVTVGCVALMVRKCRVSGAAVSGAEVSGVEVPGGGASGARVSSDFLIPPLSTLPPPPSTRFRRWALALLGLSALLTLGIYITYNLIFVQPQGRYLFPALPAIALAVALGWNETLRPATTRWAAVVLLAAAFVAALVGQMRQGVNTWSVAILLGGSFVLGAWWLIFPRLARRWQSRLQRLVYAAPFFALAFLDLAALTVFILPQLA